MKYEITAKRLQMALKRKGIIAQELAARTGIHKSSISQYVNGSHTPSNVKAGKMGEVLGVNPVWLMGYDVPMIAPKKHDGECGQMAERESLYIKQIEDYLPHFGEDDLKRLAAFAEKLYAIQEAEDELK